MPITGELGTSWEEFSFDYKASPFFPACQNAIGCSRLHNFWENSKFCWENFWERSELAVHADSNSPPRDIGSRSKLKSNINRQFLTRWILLILNMLSWYKSLQMLCDDPETDWRFNLLIEEILLGSSKNILWGSPPPQNLTKLPRGEGALQNYRFISIAKRCS